MKYKIDYNLISASESDSASRDVRKLKCIIDGNKRTIFEFTWELLRQEDFQGLRWESSVDEFYRVIEKFLIRELDGNNLKDRYQINTHNFRDFCL